jgi:large subunit ribosomal protein L17
MKHRIKGRKLSRTTSHRKALLRNLTISLVKYELIKTTLPKAKELRPFIEKVVTMAKIDSLANRRLVLSILANEEAVDKLFAKIGKRVSARNGGYTRILKYGFRTGDKAPMAIIEFVDKSSESDFSKEQEKQKLTNN